MGDHRIGQATRNHLLDMDSSNRDLCLQSESPRVQRIFLLHKLKKEIDKKSAGGSYTRFKDRFQNFTGLEAQTKALSSGTALASSSSATKNHKTDKFKSPLSTSSNSSRESDRQLKPDTDLNESTSRPRESAIKNRNCQVCLIREVRQDLMNINKMVQEHNEQISKLKSRFLRTYFERQMMDDRPGIG